MYIDPVSGRAYSVDPTTGQSQWVDAPAPPPAVRLATKRRRLPRILWWFALVLAPVFILPLPYTWRKVRTKPLRFGLVGWAAFLLIVGMANPSPAPAPVVAPVVASVAPTTAVVSTTGVARTTAVASIAAVARTTAVRDTTVVARTTAIPKPVSVSPLIAARPVTSTVTETVRSGGGGAGGGAGACGDDYYLNSDGDCIERPVSAPKAPAGATALCVDGTYSFSAHRQGTCSHHGGVARWLCRLGPFAHRPGVRKAGLEPARPKAQEPKSCVAASYTTPARRRCAPGPG
jgi:hypothetical protein